VLGLGMMYTSYAQKLEWYLDRLTNRNRTVVATGVNSYDSLVSLSGVGSVSGVEGAAIRDEDVVVLMDAYDVLVFPPIRNIHKVRQTMH
jgi:hypothetical protein